MKVFLTYLIAVNLIGFIVMGIDKGKSRKRQWRIRERDIFVLALLGGALGINSGMWIFHHKTRHLRFVIGIPALLLVNAACFVYLFRLF